MVTRQQQAIEADDLYIFGIFDKAHQHIGMLYLYVDALYQKYQIYINHPLQSLVAV
jgi:hypothetical protein